MASRDRLEVHVTWTELATLSEATGRFLEWDRHPDFMEMFPTDVQLAISLSGDLPMLIPHLPEHMPKRRIVR